MRSMRAGPKYSYNRRAWHRPAVLPLVPALAAAALGTFSTKPADACGGLFCSTMPVVQSGERIIFHVDHEARAVQAIINITYAGQASDFAWVLPLPSRPISMEPGSSFAFTVVGQQTAPQFQVQRERDGACPSPAFDAGAAASDAGAPGTGSVDVVSQAQVGPYDSVVLEGRDPDAVERWLTDNGYRVTRAMMQLVIPYLMKGDTLVALKLRKESTVGDIQPLSVTLANSEEPCIPIRLTAIAAQQNMDVTAFVLSNHGRAIPSNYLHITPNPFRINWANQGSNYRQLVTAAKDEAGGQAFVTEFAGPTMSFRNQIDIHFPTAPARRERTLGGFLLALQSLLGRAELGAIMLRNVDPEILREQGINPQLFSRCPTCFSARLQAVPYDPTAAADEIEARILVPDRAAQALFDSASHLTRLYTQLSPEDMTLDPIFDFRMDLPSVSNVHRARVVEHCSGGERKFHITLEDGTEYDADSQGNPLPVNMNLPATIRIEDMHSGRVLVDNRRAILDRLKPQPVPDDLAPHGAPNGASNGASNGAQHAAQHGCGCSLPMREQSASDARTPWILGLFGLLTLLWCGRPRIQA